MTAPGQLDFAGGEQTDPRIEKAAKALWRRDCFRGAWPKDENERQYKALWPRVQANYTEVARVALTAAGVL